MRSLSITPALALAAALLLSYTPARAQTAAGWVPCSQGAPSPISATVASARQALTAGCGPNVILYNTGTVPIYYKLGTSSVAAAVTDHPLPGGGYVVLSVGPGSTNVAAITASSTATVLIDQGSMR